MTPTELELARELARHPKWVWREGMGVFVQSSATDQTPDRLLASDETFWHAGSSYHGRPSWIRYARDRMAERCIPDLSDPATQGCLMAALGDQLQVVETFYPSLDPGAGRMWAVETRLDTSEYPWISEGATLGEALARAWLAAQGGGEHG